MESICLTPLYSRDPRFVRWSKCLVRNDRRLFGLIGSDIPQSNGAVWVSSGNDAFRMIGSIETSHNTRAIQSQQTVLSCNIPKFDGMVPTSSNQRCIIVLRVIAPRNPTDYLRVRRLQHRSRSNLNRRRFLAARCLSFLGCPISAFLTGFGDIP